MEQSKQTSRTGLRRAGRALLRVLAGLLVLAILAGAVVTGLLLRAEKHRPQRPDGNAGPRAQNSETE